MNAAADPALLERLAARGFAPALFPLYPNAFGIRRGRFAALLAPAEAGGLRPLAEPSYLIDGNFSVRVKRNGRECFVWKGKEAEATAELMAELRAFAADLAEALAGR